MRRGIGVIHPVGVDLDGCIQGARGLLEVHRLALVANQLAHVVDQVELPRVFLGDFLTSKSYNKYVRVVSSYIGQKWCEVLVCT